MTLEHISDEFDFWQDLAIKSATPKAGFINQTYTWIDKAWKSIQSTEIVNLKDLIDSTWSALAKIWDSEHAYSEKRLVKVIDLAGQEIANRIAWEFKNSQLWVFEMETKVKLIEAVEVCRSFQRVGNLYQHAAVQKEGQPIQLQIHCRAVVETGDCDPHLNRDIGADPNPQTVATGVRPRIPTRDSGTI